MKTKLIKTDDGKYKEVETGRYTQEEFE